jgi:hypothetical protein
VVDTLRVLKGWALLDEVTVSGCPAIETYAFDPGPFTLTGQLLPQDGNRTARPRRKGGSGLVRDGSGASRRGVGCAGRP